MFLVSPSTYGTLFEMDAGSIIIFILLSIFITVTVYSFFPIILATTRRKPITKKRYRWTCLGFNTIGMLIFTIFNSDPASPGPYMLWTWVFFKIGLKILDKKDLLDYSSGNILTECISCGYVSKDKFDICPKCGGKSLHFIDAETYDPNAERPQPVILPQKESVAPQANTPHRTRIKVQRKSAHSQPLPEHQTPIGDKKPSHEKRPTKHTLFLLILAVLLIGSLIFNVIQFSTNQQRKEENSALLAANNNLEELVKIKERDTANVNRIKDTLKQQNSDLQKELWANKLELTFFRNYAEILPDDGTKRYHKHGCSKLDTSNGFWIYNTEAIEDRYYECPFCH